MPCTAYAFDISLSRLGICNAHIRKCVRSNALGALDIHVPIVDTVAYAELMMAHGPCHIQRAAEPFRDFTQLPANPRLRAHGEMRVRWNGWHCARVTCRFASARGMVRPRNACHVVCGPGSYPVAYARHDPRAGPRAAHKLPARWPRLRPRCVPVLGCGAPCPRPWCVRASQARGVVAPLRHVRCPVVTCWVCSLPR